jgi:SAM-dependent methyltransferase
MSSARAIAARGTRVLSSAAVRDYESHASGRPDLVFDLHRAVLADLGFEIRPESRILDLGCGDGRFVRFMRARGLDAWGSDLSDGFMQTEADMIRSGELNRTESPFRKSELAPYQLDFPDDHFDVVLSNEVFEHVADYRSTFDEVRRVTRPGGVNLHFFPGRYCPIEQHVLVPGATLVRWYPWLLLWAVLGVRNPYQKGLSAREVARLNRDYLIRHTFYPTLREVERIVTERFGNCAFAQREYLRHGFGRTGIKAFLARVPGGPWLFAQMRVRALYFRQLS